MRINIIGLIFILGILILSPGAVWSNSLQRWANQGFLSEVTSHIFCDRYDSAYQLCDQFIRENPEDPYGYFFKAYAQMAEMTEQRDNIHQDSFFSNIDSVKLISTRILDTCQPDYKGWYHCFIGNAWAYTSLWESRFGSSTKAYKIGSKAGKHYHTALEYDSSIYDAYAGMGAFHYWKSAKAGLLRTFRIIKDEREKGISELILAADSSLISRETARKTLISILIDHQHYDSAISLATEMLDMYPGGRSFLWGLSKAYYAKKEYSTAIKYYKQYRERMKIQPGNYYNLIQCDAQISHCYEKLKDMDQARLWAVHFTEYQHNVPEEVLRDQKKNIKYLTKMLKR